VRTREYRFDIDLLGRRPDLANDALPLVEAPTPRSTKSRGWPLNSRACTRRRDDNAERRSRFCEREKHSGHSHFAGVASDRKFWLRFGRCARVGKARQSRAESAIRVNPTHAAWHMFWCRTRVCDERY
jgi:hypothetical protein